MNKFSQESMLISIRPKYVTKVFNGSKTIELRRTRPRIAIGASAFVYSSAPQKELVGSFTIEAILSGKPAKLWAAVRDHAGVSRQEYDEYFEGASKAFGIQLTSPVLFRRTVSLATLRKTFAKFHPPQTFHYLPPCRASDLLDLAS